MCKALLLGGGGMRGEGGVGGYGNAREGLHTYVGIGGLLVSRGRCQEGGLDSRVLVRGIFNVHVRKGRRGFD